MNLLTKAVNNYRAKYPKANLTMDQFYVKTTDKTGKWWIDLFLGDLYTVEEFIHEYGGA